MRLNFGGADRARPRWSNDAGRLDALRRAALGIALVHAPFWLLGMRYELARPIINVDLALALLLMLRWPKTGALALALAWGVEGMVSQALVFHFQNPTDLWRAIQFLGELDLLNWIDVKAVLVVAGFAAVLILVFRWRRDASNTPRALISIVATAILLDMLNGSSLLNNRDARWTPLNIAGSPALTTLSYAARGEPTQALVPLGPGSSITAKLGLFEWAQRYPDRSVVIVVVESFGVHASPLVRQWLLARLVGNEVHAAYGVTETRAPFAGATTAAELRLLCGLAGDYRRLSARFGGDCLPARFSRQGWQTDAFHGFHATMFDRQRWWRAIGFSETHFIGDPLFKQAARCGTVFRGICDGVVIDAAFTSARLPARLAYVLTLNTHIPLERRKLSTDAVNLCREAKTTDDVCQMIERTGETLAAIRSALPTAGAKPLVLVLGDHAPPFSEARSRSQFDRFEIPVYLLTPKDAPARLPTPVNP